jgi:TonB family protein
MSCKAFACAARAVAVAFTSTGLAAQALWAQGPRWADETDRHVQPTRIVAPRLPARGPGIEYPAEFELRATLTLGGELSAVRFDHPGVDARVVDAVSRVLHHWRFRPSFDATRCEAKAGAVSMRVSVNEVNGKPSVLVAVDETDRPNKSAATRAAPVLRTAPKAAFPDNAFQAKAEGEAEVAVKISADGKVSSASVVQSMPLAEFGENAVEAIRKATFAPVAPSSTTASFTHCALITMRFCLAVEPDYPSAACAAERK